jgi:hypothetical protein
MAADAGPWKTRMVCQAFTSQVRALRKETDGPLALRSVELVVEKVHQALLCLLKLILQVRTSTPCSYRSAAD